MKKGYKHKTGVFGTDAEHYTASLFRMIKNNNGTRRPDLLSMDGTFNPPLTLELKSGREMKGVLNQEQLHYAYTLEEDYQNLFGESPSYSNGFLPGVEWDKTRRDYSLDNIAYYYNLLNRVDSVRAEDLTTPISSIKLQWGDNFIVPHEFGLYYFAIARMMRTNEKIETILDELIYSIKEDVDEGSSHYSNRRKNRQCW